MDAIERGSASLRSGHDDEHTRELRALSTIRCAHAAPAPGQVGAANKTASFRGREVALRRSHTVETRAAAASGAARRAKRAARVRSGPSGARGLTVWR